MSYPQNTTSSLIPAALVAESIHWLRNVTEPEQLWLPGIDFAPSKVRAHGYRDAHVWPLVARLKGEAFRVHASRAWAFPSIELRAANTWPCLILDCDEPAAAVEVLYTNHRQSGGVALPRPNWTVQRRASGHFHVVYCLARPVHRGEGARASPLRRYARVSEFYRQALRADGGYNGVLTHNPMCGGHRSGGREFITTWGRHDPYSLDELAEVVPRGWRLPRVPTTEAGRNEALFRFLMRWSGMPRNWGRDVLDQALAMNARFDPPMEYAEVFGIAKSANKIQARNLASGQTQRQFSFIQVERGRKGGRIGGRRSKRRPDPNSDRSLRPWESEGVSRSTYYRQPEKRAGRNAAIRADRAAGLSLREIAANHGLSKSQVHRLV